MKERPILFSAPMVRPILTDLKWQTRRIAKLTANGHVKEVGGHRRWHPADPDATQACPYGQPGDRLWVRETWGFNPDFARDFARVCFRADPGHEYDGIKWVPSIHMPRRASRITLEVTDVRVERLQDISIEDAKAEGAWPDVSVVADCEAYFGIDTLAVNPYRAFQMLWERINGPESWAANPWVWAITFKRVQP